MKKQMIFMAALMLLMCSAESFAQMDERKPGFYTVVGGESFQLPFTYSGTVNVGVGGGIVGIGSNKCNYKGITSGVNASDTLILVIDPKRVGGVMSPWEYTNFNAKMTPEDMLVLPLVVNKKKNRREYDSGLGVCIAIGPIGVAGTNKEVERTSFQWERITDNSFQVIVPNLRPGEYGVVLRPSKYAEHEYHYLFAFTIPEPTEETAPQNNAAIQNDTIVQNDTTVQNATTIQTDTTRQQ